MKRLLSAALAGIMLLGSAMPIIAEDVPTGLTLAEGSHLVLDAESKIIDKIDGTISVADLKANFAGEVAVIGADGAAKADDAAVATDDSVGDYKAMIYGDVNRDGKIALADVSGVLQSVAGWDVSVNTFAADVDKTGKLNLADITKLLKYIAGWSDISLGNVRWVFENTKLTAENESADLDLYFESPLERIGRSNTASTGEYAYKIRLARNEYESCQFFVAANKSMEGLTVELSDFEHEYGEGTLDAEILIHYYYHFDVHTNVLKENNPVIIDSDDHAEPLLPLADSFEVAEGRNQGFHINVHTDENTPAGMYKAVLTVKDSEGNAIKQANVYTYVWDFTLPVTPYSASAFSIGWWDLHTKIPGAAEETDSHTYAMYYEFLLDNKVTAYTMPYKITDSRADAVMSDPRVTYFTVMGGDNAYPTAQSDEEAKAFYDKVQTNPVWADKAAFYLVDEPGGAGGAATIVEKYTHLTEVLGTDDYQTIMPHGNSMVDDANCIDVTAFIGDWIDILVPHTVAFKPNNTYRYDEPYPWTPRAAYNKYGESADRYHAYKEAGKKLWWYVCVTPGYPYPNLFTTYEGIMSRVLWWQQFMFDVDGFLYWSVNADWGRLPGNHSNAYPYIGDGNLIYYGERYGRTGPVLGWRMVQVRDGFDDFDYLRMAEELVGTEEIVKIVNTFTTGIVEVKENGSLLEAARDAVAKIIEENQVG